MKPMYFVSTASKPVRADVAEKIMEIVENEQRGFVGLCKSEDKTRVWGAVFESAEDALKFQRAVPRGNRAEMVPEATLAILAPGVYAAYRGMFDSGFSVKSALSDRC